MKQYLFFFLISISNFVLAQQILLKTYETQTNEIELNTFGLDEIKILNSISNKIEINLYDENPNSHTISLKEENSILRIDFKLIFLEKPTIFRKFITERTHRAYAIVKIPKNKSLTIYGDYIDIISKDYQGDLHIYIDKGAVKLHKVQKNVAIKLFQGNVFADLLDSNIELLSRNGVIKVNDTLYQKNYKKKVKNSSKFFKLKSIHANATLFNKFK